MEMSFSLLKMDDDICNNSSHITLQSELSHVNAAQATVPRNRGTETRTPDPSQLSLLGFMVAT